MHRLEEKDAEELLRSCAARTWHAFAAQTLSARGLGAARLVRYAHAAGEVTDVIIEALRAP